MDEEGPGEEAECEEAEQVKYRKTEDEPTAREVEEHNMDHAVFRSWCPHCVKGKASAYGHRAREDKDQGIPRVCVDYVYMDDKQEQGEEKDMPILVVKDPHLKATFARVVPNKGVCGYAVNRLVRDLRNSGAQAGGDTVHGEGSHAQASCAGSWFGRPWRPQVCSMGRIVLVCCCR